MKYARQIIAAVLLATMLPANAGFLTGVAVGAIANSGGKPVSPPPGVFLASDSHDVIACVKTISDVMCIVNYEKPLSPAEWAKKQGYKTVHRIGMLVAKPNDYIVMEVSK